MSVKSSLTAMNAPSGIDLTPATAPGKSPGLTVRDRRFGRDGQMARWWLGGDPVATAWFNALSAGFPRGEAMFIAAVKANSAGAPPALAAQIRAFISQEVNHSREHIAFNRAAVAAGFDLSAIDARVAAMVAMTQSHPPHVQLAITAALEHFTAMFAHEFLVHPHHFAGTAPQQVDLWRWHAVEEIEHKAVAFDTLLHVTAGWSIWRRWALRSMVMADVTVRFLHNRFVDALELLAQDGITGWRACWRLLRYLAITPGIVRRIVPAWLSWFGPRFHPWNADDRHLIAQHDGSLAAESL
jgi:predicted metal-dependent hydrolase